MTRATFTPGPWKFHAQGEANEWCMVTADSREGRWLISFRQNGELLTPQQEANARLMAASPKMLAALQYLVRWHDQLGPKDIARAEAVIAEATGGEQ